MNAFWRNKLASATENSHLPTDYERPALFDVAGDSCHLDFPPHLFDKITKTARKNGTTARVVFCTLWHAFVSRLADIDGATIGVSTSHRENEFERKLIGRFEDVWCFHAVADFHNAFDDFVAKARNVFHAAAPYRAAPFSEVVQAVAPARDPSRTPLVQFLFEFYDDRDLLPKVPFNIQRVMRRRRAVHTDLGLKVRQSTGGFDVQLNYARALFDPKHIDQLADRFIQFSEYVLNTPDQPVQMAPLLTKREYKQLVIEKNQESVTPGTPVDVRQLIITQAKSSANAIATICAGIELTYGELHSRACALAAHLTANGVVKGDIVGVYTHRSNDMIVAVLGVLYAGGAYLPLDPSYPLDRLALIVDDAKCHCVVTHEDLDPTEFAPSAKAVFLEQAGAPQRAPSPQTSDFLATDRAYVIYTSGSTGKPKGVENGHGQLANFIRAILKKPGYKARDRVLNVASLSFDMSVLDIFATLSAGGCLIIAEQDELEDGYLLGDLIAKSGASVMQATPSTWRLLLESEWQGAPGLRALCGGEPLVQDLAQQMIARVDELWNMYGPTETTVYSTCVQITDHQDIHVGRAIDNTTLYVVDSLGAPVPVGAQGELCIGGASVASGYIHNEALTDERFVEDSFLPSANRVYRTGDLAKWRFDGNLHILGRRDSQVKIRGHRIELGEIEKTLEALDEITRAAVIVHEDHVGDATLVAYFVASSDDEVTGSDLRRALRQKLPRYMVPQLFVRLDEMPLTSSKKVDRKALPHPTGVTRATNIGEPLRDEFEQGVGQIWSELLGTDLPVTTDNFFELGGQSLQVAQMIVRIKNKWGVVIAPRIVVFETLEQIAADIRSEAGVEA